MKSFDFNEQKWNFLLGRKAAGQHDGPTVQGGSGEIQVWIGAVPWLAENDWSIENLGTRMQYFWAVIWLAETDWLTISTALRIRNRRIRIISLDSDPYQNLA